jgi:hypothetical protein
LSHHQFIIKIFDTNEHHPLDDETKHRFLGEAHFDLATFLIGGKAMTIPLSNAEDKGAHE